MILSEQTEVRYVPSVGGNDKAKKDEQVVVVLQLPTALERSKWNKLRYSHEKGVMISTIDRDTESVITRCVQSIEGLRVKEKSGTQRSITTAAELLSLRHGVGAVLVEELTTILLLADEIPEQDAKN